MAAEYTENLGLKKPAQEDFYDVDDFNGNADIIDAQITELKKSVSDGKEKVAVAITKRGVITAADAAFQTMADNIEAITTIEQGTADATAAAEDIVSPKTAYVAGEKVTGTLAEGAAITDCNSITLSSNYFYVRFPRAAYRTDASSGYPEIRVSQADFASAAELTAAKILSGLTVCGIAGTATADANATAAQILSGKTAYVKGAKVTGTIPSKAAATITPGTTNQTIAAGQYLAGAQTIKGSANLKAENIKQGVDIMGIIGSLISAAVSNMTYYYSTTSVSIPISGTVFLEIAAQSSWNSRIIYVPATDTAYQFSSSGTVTSGSVTKLSNPRTFTIGSSISMTMEITEDNYVFTRTSGNNYITIWRAH